jgi:LysM repeat protein
MMRRTHIAVLLLAACLAGCGSYSLLDPQTTASFSPPQSGQTTPTTSSDRGNATALNSLFARAADGKLNTDAPEPAVKPIALASTGETAAPVAPPPAAPEKVTEPHGRAYLFRGVAGLIYSRGMDRLAERITRAGVPASVDTYLVWRGVADQAVRDYRRDPAPITLIGHSMGGDSALAFAEMLNGENIPVSLLVTYDPSRIAADVPPNVERYINIYQSSNVMGGGNVVQGARFHGHYASYNLKNHSEIIHINIEKAERIQEQLVGKITQLGTTPANAQGEAVPLRLEVPSEASIELWDSGERMTAHAGDTLKSLAAANHVPTWTLAQINAVSEKSPLTEGQRVIVPRHLAPMPAPSTITSYAPVGR